MALRGRNKSTKPSKVSKPAGTPRGRNRARSRTKEPVAAQEASPSRGRVQDYPVSRTKDYPTPKKPVSAGSTKKSSSTKRPSYYDTLRKQGKPMPKTKITIKRDGGKSAEAKGVASRIKKATRKKSSDWTPMGWRSNK